MFENNFDVRAKNTTANNETCYDVPTQQWILWNFRDFGDILWDFLSFCAFLEKFHGISCKLKSLCTSTL